MKISIGLYALLALIVIPVYAFFSSPNEFSRWALVTSVVEDHTIEVSRQARLLGPRFEDLAIVGGRVYSNKAPGLALLSAPGYLAARPFLGAPARANLRAAVTAMRWTGTTIPLLLLAFGFGSTAKRLGGEAGFVTAVLLFGTLLFAYGLLLFSHTVAAAALFGAWALLFVYERAPLAAGALLGIAVMSEYPVAVPTAAFVLALALTRDWKRFALTVAGGVPFAIALTIYQHAAFGSYLLPSYQFEKVPAYRAVLRQGLFGIDLPRPSIVIAILIGPSRGLLLFSPILIAAIAAFPAARRRLSTRAFVTLIAAPVALIMINAGFPGWHGGWNFGPRFLVPAIPFLLFPLAFVRVRWWHAVLFGASAGVMALTTLTFPFTPVEFPIPWGTLALPLLSNGLTAPNLTRVAAIPFAIVIAGLLLALPKRFAAATLGGVVIAIAVGFAAERATRNDARLRIERAYFEDVYFQRPGTLEREGVAIPSLVRRRALEMEYGPLPF